MDWQFFVVIGVLMAGAIVIRRKVNDPDNAFGQWYKARVHPRMMQAGKVAVVLTVAVWLIIYLGAPEGDPSGLGDLFKGIFQSFGESGGNTKER
ncbi:MAG: hypothetical protein O7A64_06180 [Alphaproteobacteria bacterium]|nr:hypothetical protein [Alphaproteobacteria bacterium]